MNYFLIANNELISDKTIENLPLNEEDIVILYNHQFPLKWKKIKDHKNKILFLRSFGKGYHGEKNLNENKELYIKIILTSPKVSDFEVSNYRKNYGLSKISKYSYLSDIDRLNIFNKDVHPQSGLISYIYIINNLKFNRLYLIGFTNIYKKRVNWRGHSKEIEQDFYKNEIKKGFITKIDN